MKGKASVSTASSKSKRGRGRPQRSIPEDKSGVEQIRAEKRQRKSDSIGKREHSETLEDKDVEIGDDENSKYESYMDTPLAKLKSWEKVVKKVNTVEKNNNQLTVYFETLALP